MVAGAARPPAVFFVGMNHDIDFDAETGRLRAWAPSARVARPACGRDPLSWAAACEGGAAAAPLGFSPAFARDGLSLPVALAHEVPSLEALRGEVDALRAAAAALAEGADGEDYAQRSTEKWDARSQLAAAEGAPLPEWEERGRSGPRVPLRWRETYLSCLPPGFAVYAEAPSAAVRGPEWLQARLFQRR